MQELNKIDVRAYICCASVYMQFKDIEEFKKDINKFIHTIKSGKS